VLFLTLLEVLPGRAGDQPAILKRIRSVTPPAGIKILGVYFLFGRYDGAILFEAPDSEQPRILFCEPQRKSTRLKP